LHKKNKYAKTAKALRIGHNKASPHCETETVLIGKRRSIRQSIIQSKEGMFPKENKLKNNIKSEKTNLFFIAAKRKI